MQLVRLMSEACFALHLLHSMSVPLGGHSGVNVGVLLDLLTWVLNTYSHSSDPFINEMRRRERLATIWLLLSLLFLMFALGVMPDARLPGVAGIAQGIAADLAMTGAVVAAFSATVGLFYLLRRITFLKEVESGWWMPPHQ